MSCTVITFPNHGLIWARYTGEVEIQDLMSLIPPITSEPPPIPATRVLHDASAMTGSPITMHEFLMLRDRMDLLYSGADEPARHAVYAPKDLQFGMARMYQGIIAQTGLVHPEPFRTLAEAIAFLALPVEAERELYRSMQQTEAG